MAGIDGAGHARVPGHDAGAAAAQVQRRKSERRALRTADGARKSRPP